MNTTLLIKDNTICFHCGKELNHRNHIVFQNIKFCCNECKSAYKLITESGLSKYYTFQEQVRNLPKTDAHKYDFLEDETIVSELLDFNDESLKTVSLYLPTIHCTSCIWILENLSQINPNIKKSTVNFTEKKIKVNFSSETTLKDLVLLLTAIGYEPYISLDNLRKEDSTKTSEKRTLIYKIGIAGFCFGNIMMFSLPEYFETGEFWIEKYKYLFRYLVLMLSLPVMFYAGKGFLTSAYKSLQRKKLNMDVPIALGLIVMFIRSCIDVLSDYGQGFFDSLAGLVFFLLIGQFFRQQTYKFLSFERDFKSYFPIAVTKIVNKTEVPVKVYDIAIGDKLLIRNHEIIPTDCGLVSDKTAIDYSFVTGESAAIQKNEGDEIFAGGKQIGSAIEVLVTKNISQSYLTQLWSDDAFSKNKSTIKTSTDRISKYFTPIVLVIAFSSLAGWFFVDTTKAFNVFTAVLIIACPCAISLTVPFTLGNAIRIMGKHKFYLKNTDVIEQMSQIDTLVFDKTGTITSQSKTNISYEGVFLKKDELISLKNIINSSNHPLSRGLYNHIPSNNFKEQILNFNEIEGLGMQAKVNNRHYRIGSADFLGIKENAISTVVHIEIDQQYKGKFIFSNVYRKGIEELFEQLNSNYLIKILSGDNESEKQNLQKLLPKNTELLFHYKPQQKLDYIKSLQQKNKKVMMFGDGLNDAGALVQSNVGVAISEDVNVFSPACDAILDASKFTQITDFLVYSKKCMKVIYLSFTLSLLYNATGISIALTGNLSPLIAAILMPLSSISVVSFATLMTNYYAKKTIENFKK